MTVLNTSQINLLPDYYLKQRSQNRVNIICVVLFAVVMGSIVVAESVFDRQFHQRRADHKRINERFAAESGFVTNFFELQAGKNKMLLKAKEIAALEERIPRSYILATVTGALPKGVVLNSVEVKEQPRAAPKSDKKKNKVKGKRRKKVTNVKKSSDAKSSKDGAGEENIKLPPLLKVELGGTTKNSAAVSQFMAVLKAKPIIKAVELRSLSETPIAKELYWEFKIALELDSSMDVLDILHPSAPAETGSSASTGGEVTQ